MKKLFLLLLCFSVANAYAAPSFAPNTCVQDKQDVCIDATPCRLINGVNACLAGTANPPANSVILTENCWRYQAAFTCVDTASIDTCEPLRDRGCGQVNTQCISYNDAGRCMSSTQTFQCPDKPPTVTETTVCQTALCQSDGTGCFDTSRPLDKDFGIAVAMMETQREAGVKGLTDFFKGEMDKCTIKTIGGSSLKSCCEEIGGGGAFTDYSVKGVAAREAVKGAAGAAGAVAKEQVVAGSKYVYDALFSSATSSLAGEGAAAAAGAAGSAAAEGAAAGAAGGAAAGTTFGAYGFQFSYAAGQGFTFVAFDPTTLIIAIVIAVISAYLQCDPEDSVTQMKRGQNLCVYIDSYCGKQALGACIEKKERHCCFTSVLAKIINRQGRAQLGLPLNVCDGFTQEQIQAIDFSSIDFTEFIATITPTPADVGVATGDVTNTVTKKVTDYYGN